MNNEHKIYLRLLKEKHFLVQCSYNLVVATRMKIMRLHKN